jgi:serine/threonine-protein kinase
VSTSQQADPLIGRLVDGRYRVRARIARGGMATVYVATDLRLERRIALKVMHGHLSDDTVFQSRFIQEARAAARLADPHVVNVFDQGQDGDMAYLVMEYLPGITLRELIREQKRLSVPQAITIMDAVLSGLAAAHRAGIVHRDVKPENVLLAEDGRVKIGDFGLARATTANTATGAQLLGTIAYLAPELVTRGTADARSDIYALGIMLYELLTGEQPYKGEQPMQIAFQHATDSVPRPSAKNPAIPEQLDELVLWATERSPDDRPVDAREMLDRLREIENELGVAPERARTATTGIIRDEGLSSDDLTQVIPSTGAITTVPTSDADNGARLRRATKRRAAKGVWIVLFVLLLAAGAGGAGWWFGSGPGSLVVVPSVTGTFADAQARLLQDTLVAVQREEHSLDVAAGQVIRTDPGAGDRVDRETSVDVYISLGPAPVTFEAFSGKSEADARTILGDAFIDVAEDNTTFYTERDAGTVVGVMIQPADGSEAVPCGDGCTVREGDSATLWVSLGGLPSVVGESADSARRILTDAGLQVAEGVAEEASNEIARGDVIRTSDREGGGWWRPGDPISLVVSSGPPLFPIPDVDGETLGDARRILEDAGFRVAYNSAWDVFPIARVTSQDPEADSQHVKGTTVRLELSFTD